MSCQRKFPHWSRFVAPGFTVDPLRDDNSPQAVAETACIKAGNMKGVRPQGHAQDDPHTLQRLRCSWEQSRTFQETSPH